MHNPVHKFWDVENNLDKLWIICEKKISTCSSVENHTIFPHFLHTEIHNVKLAEFFYLSIFPQVVLSFSYFPQNPQRYYYCCILQYIFLFY